MEPIVIGVDDSPTAAAALSWGAGLGALLHAPVVAVTALELPQIVGRAATLEELTGAEQQQHESEEWLRRTISTRLDSGADVRPKVVTGHPVSVLVDESRHATALVVGARGAGGFARLLLGSVSTGVVHHAHTTVIVLHGNPQRPGPRVVVGIDHSEGARAALAWAADYVQRIDGTLTIVNTWDWPSFQEVPILYSTFDPRGAARDLVEQAAAATGLPDQQVQTVVAKGNAARRLLDQSPDADLLVVGSRGHGGFAGMLLGSVSSQCVHHAACPVAVVHEDRHDRT